MTPTPRKRLSADALVRNLHQSFRDIPDPRTGIPTIALIDALMWAMFALKDPSMLAFDQRRQRDEMIFHMQHVPCDDIVQNLAWSTSA